MTHDTMIHRAWLLMRDGQPRTAQQVATHLGTGTACATARLRDLRKSQYGAHVVLCERDHDGTPFYRIAPGQLTHEAP